MKCFNLSCGTVQLHVLAVHDSSRLRIIGARHWRCGFAAMLSPISVTIVCIKLFPRFDWAQRLHHSLGTRSQRGQSHRQLRQIGWQERSSTLMLIGQAIANPPNTLRGKQLDSRKCTQARRRARTQCPRRCDSATAAQLTFGGTSFGSLMNFTLWRSDRGPIRLSLMYRASTCGWRLAFTCLRTACGKWRGLRKPQTTTGQCQTVPFRRFH